MWQKQLEKWHNGDWFHHYHTVPAHSLSLQEFLDNNGKTINLHPLDYLDVAPTEFFLFPKLNWCWGSEIS
jgi:alkyl hydroperoxide reductase subunit AhpC